jgi:4-amino-4-deoxy-L-arabinose transferase-like glycosyltransferase
VKNSTERPDQSWLIAWWLLAVAVFGVTVAIRIRLLSTPLERDEGEYAYAGQLLLQGIPPYKLVYNMKFPGTYGAYAVVMSIFGQTIAGIHLGLLVINAATAGLIFLLGKRLVDWLAGIVAATSYAVLSASVSVLGLAAHATHFVVLPVLGGILLLLNQSERHVISRLFASGFLFGLGVLMKQPAVFFALFGGVYLLFRESRRWLGLTKLIVRNVVFVAGVILPFGLTCLFLWFAGVFDKFWFWTIDYAREYATLVPLSQAGRIFADSFNSIVGPVWPLWALGGCGLLVGLLDASHRRATAFLLALLVFSVFAVSSGFYFRNHYFILLLPAVCLLVGIAISKLSDLTSRGWWILRLAPVFLLGAAASLPLFWQKKLFFTDPPVDVCRAIYPESPFPESIRIAEYVRSHSDPNDSIAVLGSEPQIYFYASRHSATGYIYMYGLMEPHKFVRDMQAEMVREIEVARPKYLISVVMEDSWLARPSSNRQIFAWANDYTHKYYEVAGFVNMVAPGKSEYYFDEVPTSVAQLGSYILIYKRKS